MRMVSHWTDCPEKKLKSYLGKKYVIVFSSNRIEREFLLPLIDSRQLLSQKVMVH